LRRGCERKRRNLDRVDPQETGEIHNPLWFWEGCALELALFRQKLFFGSARVVVAGGESPRGFLSERACSILAVDHNVIE
jgi:hypothetical protein